MGGPPRKASAGTALRSALAKLLRETARAVEQFDVDPTARAHFIRTRMKRLQSLARLVPKGASWREMFLPPCRELKDLFAEMRDAYIVRALAEKYAPGEARHLRAAAKPDTRRAAHLAEFAAGVLSDYPSWKTVGWEAIADRAVGTYREARNGWKEARRSGAPDAAFHEWRRRVKRLLYQCEYLGGRARLVRLTARVDRLGETLGEIQDVCMAEDWIAEHVGKVPRDLPRSKKTLRRRSLEQGGKLFAAKPRDFRKMLG
ncbi:MAG: CHAD domain-containing protein [Chthoniobacterales bacterium]